jgi:hypothetical protein
LDAWKSLAPPAGRPTEHHPYPDLQATIIDHSFPIVFPEAIRRPPMLSLIPPRERQPDSGPAFPADHILKSWAAPDSLVAVSRRGVEVAPARSFLAARQRDRRPTLILATSDALAQLLAALDRRGLRFRLPAGSRVLETVGGAGTRAPSRQELLARLAEGLTLPAEAVVRSYGVTGLTSRFYAGYSALGKARAFRPQRWARVRILDAASLEEASTGAPGRISVFDLGNAGSAVSLLTEELGRADEEGFHLAGTG